MEVIPRGIEGEKELKMAADAAPAIGVTVTGGSNYEPLHSLPAEATWP